VLGGCACAAENGGGVKIGCRVAGCGSDETNDGGGATTTRADSLDGRGCTGGGANPGAGPSG
jgi:hypothetical protein